MGNTYQTKMSNRELISHLGDIGVTFNHISQGQAINFLEKNNYYYKLAAFRKNFPKRDDKYLNLDFSYLQDLASLDMKIRAILLSIAVNVEHFIKVELSRLINNNVDEDGYAIIREFKNSEFEKYYNITKKKFKKSQYQKDMYNKRKHDYPYWALLEHMDFGCLLKFVQFYNSKYPSKSLKKAIELGDGARQIRNACAHNSVFIINIFDDKSKLKNVPATITSLAQEAGVLKYKNYRKVNDLISLLILSRTYCSEAVKEYQKQAIKDFIDRAYRNKQHYERNVELTKIIVIFKKIVDSLV